MESCCLFAPCGPLFSCIASCGNALCEALLPSWPSSACCCSFPGVVLVTGGNRGVGFHVAKIYLRKGFSVVITSRSASRGEAAVQELKKLSGSEKIEFLVLDLDDFSSILSFLKGIQARKLPIRTLINNAGAIVSDSIKVNHTAHFAVTIGLVPHFRLAEQLGVNVSVVNVASCAHMGGSVTLECALDRILSDPTGSGTTASCGKGGDWQSYSESKAANVAFSLALSRFFPESSPSNESLAREETPTLLSPAETRASRSLPSVSVFSYHPGVMLTDLWSPSNGNSEARADNGATDRLRALSCLCVKHPMVSAAGAVGLAGLAGGRCRCSSGLRECTWGSNGGYFQQCCCVSVLPARPSPLLLSSRLQDKLWRASLVSIRSQYKELYDLLREVTPEAFPAASDNPIDFSLPNKSCYVSPAWPASELLAFAPHVICVACLF